MILTEQEKDIMIKILDKHLEEIQDNEKLAGQQAAEIGAELRYEEILQSIKKKLSE